MLSQTLYYNLVYIHYIICSSIHNESLTSKLTENFENLHLLKRHIPDKTSKYILCRLVVMVFTLSMLSQYKLTFAYAYTPEKCTFTELLVGRISDMSKKFNNHTNSIVYSNASEIIELEVNITCYKSRYVHCMNCDSDD